jgi:4-hydroxy-2-oxoheptanedioate aldolase
MVRVRTNSEAEIQRALDIGTAGVQVPQVETREEAQRAVDAARYDPIGSRGLSQYVRAGDYWGSETYTDDQNEEVFLMVQVEGERGVENIEEILSVEGLDAVFLGPYDLSQSLGIPGQVTHEKVESLMTEVCDRAAEANTVVGAFADTPEIANRWIDAGVQYVTLGVDVGLCTEHLGSLAEDVNTDAN